ncbi:MAG TPA: hypothetical protein VI997_10075 [Candidatus Thermoplasmatota archaeon]|nr:hypothetical protein [Candidatus Thermoplasmatota archaeon]
MTRTLTPQTRRSSALAAFAEGFGTHAALPADLVLRYGKAVASVAAADGELSEAEVACFCTTMRAWGATDLELDECFGAPEPSGAPLEAALRPLARLILYDAIRVAAADGFGPVERDAARRAAERLGLDPGLVPAIEGLLGVEEALRAARLRLLSPG